MKENKSIIITIIAIVILISLLIIATLVGEKEKKVSTKRDAETVIKNAQNESKEVKEKEKRKFIYISKTNMSIL